LDGNRYLTLGVGNSSRVGVGVGIASERTTLGIGNGSRVGSSIDVAAETKETGSTLGIGNSSRVGVSVGIAAQTKESTVASYGVGNRLRVGHCASIATLGEKQWVDTDQTGIDEPRVDASQSTQVSRQEDAAVTQRRTPLFSRATISQGNRNRVISKLTVKYGRNTQEKQTKCETKYFSFMRYCEKLLQQSSAVLIAKIVITVTNEEVTKVLRWLSTLNTNFNQ
jgi:hypothetical protein